MKLVTGPSRLRAAVLLAAACYFAGAAAYHAHDLPRPAHDRAALEPSAVSHRSVDECAVCKLARSTAQVATPVGFVHPDDSLSFALFVSAPHVLVACDLFPSSPRAPPLA
jgi:hypothetical protein